jgi:hypothetical protein
MILKDIDIMTTDTDVQAAMAHLQAASQQIGTGYNEEATQRRGDGVRHDGRCARHPPARANPEGETVKRILGATASARSASNSESHSPEISGSEQWPIMSWLVRWLPRRWRLWYVKRRARRMSRQERVAVVRSAGWRRLRRRKTELWRSPAGRVSSLYTATVSALLLEEQENR